MAQRVDQAAALAEVVGLELRKHADPAYVPGTVAARHPGKPVLGIRIPLLRGAVHTALRTVTRAAGIDGDLVERAADLLWHGRDHESELAACMLLRLTDSPISPQMLRRWSQMLDNWLSVDELGGVVGTTVTSGRLVLTDLEFLAEDTSPWQRRLYLVSLIAPIRRGADPSQIAALPRVLCDPARPVRKAAEWLVRSTTKARPEVAAQFRLALPADAPPPLVRLL